MCRSTGTSRTSWFGILARRSSSAARLAGLFLLVSGCLALLPATAHAQSSFAGVVRDTSGAVLPGVTVEAASPVLIEKTRSVVTDVQGRYAIVDLSESEVELIKNTQ